MEGGEIAKKKAFTATLREKSAIRVNRMCPGMTLDETPAGDVALATLSDVILADLNGVIFKLAFLNDVTFAHLTGVILALLKALF